MSDNDSTPLPANRHYQCRGCEFNLTGLIIEDGKLTCPECGRSGSLADVAEPAPPKPPTILRTLWRMCRWTFWLLLCSIALGIAPRIWGSRGIAEFAFLPGLAAMAAGIGVPLLVAADVASHYSRERRRLGEFGTLAIMGVAVNFILCALAIIAGAVLIITLFGEP